MRKKVQVWIYRKNEEGSLLVLLLLTKPDRGYYWQPVTGKVDSGESMADAALREASEETALSFYKKPKKLSYEFEYVEKRSGETAHEECYSLEAKNNAVIIDPGEHSAFEWVFIEQVEDLLKFESNRLGLMSLKEELNVHEAP